MTTGIEYYRIFIGALATAESLNNQSVEKRIKPSILVNWYNNYLGPEQGLLAVVLEQKTKFINVFQSTPSTDRLASSEIEGEPTGSIADDAFELRKQYTQHFIVHMIEDYESALAAKNKELALSLFDFFIELWMRFRHLYNALVSRCAEQKEPQGWPKVESNIGNMSEFDFWSKLTTIIDERLKAYGLSQSTKI